VYIEYKYTVFEINIIKKFGYIIFGTFKKSLEIKMILYLIDKPDVEYSTDMKQQRFRFWLGNNPVAVVSICPPSAF